VVFDRFIYDELANLNLRNAAMRIYVRAILALVPQPDLSFVLDADPMAARARKPEYPMEFLEISRKAYLELSGFAAGIKLIHPAPVEQVGRQIWSEVANTRSAKAHGATIEPEMPARSPNSSRPTPDPAQVRSQGAIPPQLASRRDSESLHPN
jgi:hypothetical protein